MSDTIHNIQAQFREIREILKAAPAADTWSDADYVARLSEEVEESYFAFNTAIAEGGKWCDPCTSRRNSLRDVVVLLSELEGGAAVTPATVARMEAFPAEIDALIAQIDRALQA
jgi:hypothetical protein